MGLSSVIFSSWLPLLLLLLLIIIPFSTLPLLFMKHRRKKSNAIPSKLPPGPSGLPILGNLLQLTSLPHRKLWLLSREYGPLMHLQLGHVPPLVVSSARFAKEVMKSQDLHFCSRPQLAQNKKLSYNYSDIAFAPYGDDWRVMRKISTIELLSVKRVQSYRHIREDEVAKMVSSISRAAAASSSSSSSSSARELINLSDLVTSVSYDIFCRVAFGKSYYGGSKHEKMEFHEAIKEAGAMLGSFFLADYLPWMWWADVITGLRGRLERNFSKLDAFYDLLIDDHKNHDKPETDEDDFVDVLLKVREEFHLTNDHIKGILMNVLHAGTETSSTVVVWAMVELMRNPKQMTKVQDEVRGMVGKKRKVEESDLHQLKYLKSVIKETMRLHPPGPLLIPRETIRDCRIEGYEVAAKTRVIVNAYAIGRDHKEWKCPNEFLPERFEDNPIDYKGQNFELIPFGAGRRICPGMYFATMNYELTLANLLYAFNWDLPTGMDRESLDTNEAAGIVVKKRNPLSLVPTKYGLA